MAKTLWRTSTDLVLTDQNMPRRGRHQPDQEPAQSPEVQGHPILILTTESSDQMKQAGRNAGATGLDGQALRSCRSRSSAK